MSTPAMKMTWAAPLALALALHTLPAEAREPFREEFSRTYPLAETGRVSLENVNGDLRIQAWDRAEVKVEAVKEADSAEYLGALVIDVQATADRLSVRTRYPEGGHGGGGQSGSVRYVLTVPRRADLAGIHLVNGSLEVSGVAGGLEGQLVNGSVRGQGLAGRVRVETVNGHIDLAWAQLSAADRIEAQSVNGAIELSLPGTAGARLHASTVHGRLHNDFGVRVDEHRFVGADMEGTFGDGAADIELESVNGAISVRKS